MSCFPWWQVHRDKHPRTFFRSELQHLTRTPVSTIGVKFHFQIARRIVRKSPVLSQNEIRLLFPTHVLQYVKILSLSGLQSGVYQKRSSHKYSASPSTYVQPLVLKNATPIKLIFVTVKWTDVVSFLGTHLE